ncbi:polysaccharide biosynthesis/export family protein [Leptothermofonsia sp. ETS-13]|uniref:polysaccharide biosynthesis/export family protein n=1 Tax=Leptothermofonsia sp. ETS-13 TaxID=3035696 RepID=UPI003B9F8ACC
MPIRAPEGRLKHLSLLVAGLTLPVCVAIAHPLSGVAQQSARANPAPPGLSASIDDAYTLGAGDRVRVEVFKLPQFTGEYQVLIDGSLNLPQVGSVAVDGMTLKEAADAISGRYARILKYPIVNLNLLAARPVQVGISGEVNRPGAYTVSAGDAASQLPTVTRALERAGGITQMADLRRIEVRRSRRAGEQIIQVDLWEFLNSGDSRRDIVLRAGDSILVPTISKPNLAESIQLASASFASDRSQGLNIAVVGEVYRPGPHTVTASARTGAAGETGQAGGTGGISTPPTVTRAIQVAGGIRPQADVRRIQVRRLTRTGSEQTISIDLWKLLKEGDVSQDLFLQDRDTIVIPTASEISPADSIQIAAASFSPDSIRVNIVGEVKNPGLVRIPPNTPLNQAVLAAGGFTTRARKSSVDLIRLNPNGTISKRKIDVNFDNELNEKTNPPLYNDDIIIVNRSALTTFSDNLNSVLTPINGFLSLFSIYRIITGQ